LTGNFSAILRDVEEHARCRKRLEGSGIMFHVPRRDVVVRAVVRDVGKLGGVVHVARRPRWTAVDADESCNSHCEKSSIDFVEQFAPPSYT